MIRKTALSVILTGGILFCFAVSPLMAQGISRQEYTGLDKYLTQDIAEGFSFVGVRAAEFLTIPVGSRGIAMGSAYSAVCDDISSIWWNPAGLGFLEQKEVMFTYVDYTLDINYSYVAAAAPLGDGQWVVGGFVGHLNIPEIEITTVATPNGTGQFYKAYDMQLGGSVACNLSDRFATGINMKYVHQDVFSNIGGSAFAIDAGVIYHTKLADKEIRFAFSIQNLGTNITMDGPNMIHEVGPEGRNEVFPTGYTNYSDDNMAFSRRANRQVKLLSHTYRLPTAAKIAVAYNLYTGEKGNFLAAGEVWRNSNLPMSYSLGTELNYNFDAITSAALRMGWKIQTDEFTDDNDAFNMQYWGDDPVLRGLSFGGGIKRTFGSGFISFSYAYRNKGRLSADNFFTVGLGF